VSRAPHRYEVEELRRLRPPAIRMRRAIFRLAGALLFLVWVFALIGVIHGAR
jgi:predicted permease